MKKKTSTPLVDSKGRPIYGAIPDGESREAIVREIDYWRARGRNIASVPLRFPEHHILTIDTIRTGVLRATAVYGRLALVEEQGELRSKAASGPRRVAEKTQLAALYAARKTPSKTDNTVAMEIAKELKIKFDPDKRGDDFIAFMRKIRRATGRKA